MGKFGEWVHRKMQDAQRSMDSLNSRLEDAQEDMYLDMSKYDTPETEDRGQNEPPAAARDEAPEEDTRDDEDPYRDLKNDLGMDDIVLDPVRDDDDLER